MSERKKPYPFDEFEPKWQGVWEETNAFRTPNPGDEGFDGSKPKFYVLDMFPYPSGQGLHVGHPEGYTATDILGRTKKRQGFNVLHPMGWDAFGLPAEQYAIKTGQHPRVTTEANVANFKRQLKSLGFAYDWEREVNTTAPDYVRWTQWIFLQLYHSYVDDAGRARPVSELEAKGWSREEIDAVRLAFVAESPVNWSPTLGTVLANEEVEEWRAKGETVERRPLRQWMLRITAFAQRLIDDLEGLDWPDGIKALQRNWIGRSEGASVRFGLSGRGEEIEVYTTRPDTLFGATYMVLAPEHPLVDAIVSEGQKEAVEAYRKACASKSDLERTELAKEKTGVATGAMAVNPVNGEEIPVWIADYVLMGYGTGAIMAVPGHDERDYEFAEQFGLPIVQVVVPPGDEEFSLEAFNKAYSSRDKDDRLIWNATFGLTDGGSSHGFEGYEGAFSGHGTAVNSGFLDGLPTAEAKAKMIGWLEEKGIGTGTVNYKLRDWLFSRQRYWGEPFPIVWEGGKHRAIGEDELPLLQPELEDFKPTGSPEGPLAKATDWIAYSETATRETNTMPQWAGSCWYYLRYCDPKNEEAFISKEAADYWLGDGTGGVDLYIGGTEHAVLHLLYARFWHKVLYDLGHLPTPEPFQGLVNQGLIMGEDGQKMSKSRGNVVNPDEVVNGYGADALRLYEMFMGPLRDSKPWSMKGVEGVSRFLARVWRLVMEQGSEDGGWSVSAGVKDVACDGDKALRKVVHETVKKVTEDVEKLAFNTAISQMMVCTNALTQAEVKPLEAVVTLLEVLNPFAPHLTEELYSQLRGAFPELSEGLICDRAWPVWNEDYLVEDEVEIVLQVNGKLRDKMKVAKEATKEEVEALALANGKVKEHTEGLTVRKVVVVPGRLVNVVAS